MTTSLGMLGLLPASLAVGIGADVPRPLLRYWSGDCWRALLRSSSCPRWPASFGSKCRMWMSRNQKATVPLKRSVPELPS